MVGGNVPGIKGKLFNTAVQTKLANLKATGNVTHAFWDRLVFRKVVIFADVCLSVNIEYLYLDPSGFGRSNITCDQRVCTYQCRCNELP